MNPKLDALRHRIEHEDNLVSQRLSWLVASQSFLVTAFAILLNAPPVPRLPAYGRGQATLITLVPTVALACIALLWLTVAGAIWSMAKLRAAAALIAGPDDLPIHSSAAIRRLGLVGPVAIPGIFFALWIAVLVTMKG